MVPPVHARTQVRARVARSSSAGSDQIKPQMLYPIYPQPNGSGFSMNVKREAYRNYSGPIGELSGAVSLFRGKHSLVQFRETAGRPGSFALEAILLLLKDRVLAAGDRLGEGHADPVFGSQDDHRTRFNRLALETVENRISSAERSKSSGFAASRSCRRYNPAVRRQMADR